MLTQSYWYVLLQFVNLFFGLFITLYIAKSVDVITFSIFSVYNILSSLFMTFTFLGHETVLSRNALYWLNNNDLDKINRLIHSIYFSRIFVSLILIIPSLFYIYYISQNKYEGSNFILFSSFLISSFFSALSNASGLILKSFNRFLTSFFIMTTTSLIGRVVALILFLKIGFNEFILALIVTPIFSFAFSIFYIKKYFSLKFKYFGINDFKSNKYFTLSGYLGYIKNSIDQIIVSIFLTPEILSVYNLSKKIEVIGRVIIDGFFDPLTQRLIKFKDDTKELKALVKSIIYIRKLISILLLLFTIAFNFFIDSIINYLGLEKYYGLNSFLMISSWTVLIYLLQKIEWNVLGLFDNQKQLFHKDLIVAFFSVLSATVFFKYMDFQFIYLNRLVSGVFTIIITNIFLKNSKSLKQLMP